MARSDHMPGGHDPGSGDGSQFPAAGLHESGPREFGGTAEPSPAAGDVIELTVPAQSTYLPVVRTASAGLAARLSFTFDEIEDLRIAVDEACVMLLSLPGPHPADTAILTCRFMVLPDALAVRVSAPVDVKAVLPAEQSFAWQVLTAHAAEVSGTADGGHASVELLKRRRTR